MVPLSIATTPPTKESPIASEKSPDHKSENVFIRKNGIEIELPQSTEEYLVFYLYSVLQQLIRNLQDYIDKLKDILDKNGIEYPEI